MTDRFSAQLRQHLVDTANERPADGQLASVVERVAVTGQRHPLVARLTWTPGRIGPVPSVAIRYGLVGVALLLAAMAGAILAGGGGRGTSTVFEGTWTSIDPGDRSGQTLVVGPGAAPAVYFEDGYASGAACVLDEVKRFTARGTGEISSNRLVVSFPDGGGCGVTTVDIVGAFDYDAPTDTLIGDDGVVWTRALPERGPSTPGPSTDVSATDVPDPVGPSPRPGEATYDSAIHGISINYPTGWQVRPASEAWAGGPLGFDSPAADVIFDPALGDRLYLILASQPYGGLTQDEWRDKGVDSLCAASGVAFGSWRVDGADAFVIGCRATQSAAMVFAESRGYLIRLVVASDEPGLADTYSWDWLKPALASVDLRPEDAVDAPSPTVSGCIQFDNGGTYTASAGPVPLSMQIPAGATWHGLRDSFSLLRSPCVVGGPARIEASLVSQVYTDVCDWAGAGVEVDSAAAAADMLGAPVVAEGTEVTLDGYSGVRVEILVGAGFDPSRCDDGVIHLWTTPDGPFTNVDPDSAVSVYLLDVEGQVLAIAATHVPGDEQELPTLVAELDGIVASLQIGS